MIFVPTPTGRWIVSPPFLFPICKCTDLFSPSVKTNAFCAGGSVLGNGCVTPISTFRSDSLNTALLISQNHPQRRVRPRALLRPFTPTPLTRLLFHRGNNAVSTAGISDSVLKIAEGAGAYQDYSGGRATRVINPCDNSTCAARPPPSNCWFSFERWLTLFIFRTGTWSEDIDAMPR